MSDFVALIARQRSGTNVFRDIVGQHPRIHCCPEILNAEDMNDVVRDVREQNYFNYIKKSVTLKGVSVLDKTFQCSMGLFGDFLRYLEAYAGAPWLVLDLKYNALGQVGGPRCLASPPKVLKYLKDRQTRILDITRQNLLRYHLSNLRGTMSGVWTSETSAPKDAAIQLDLDHMMHVFAQQEQEARMIRNELAGYEHYMTFDYAELFPGGGKPYAKELIAQFFSWLDLETCEIRTSKYHKLSSLPLGKAISNYDEVAETLAGTPYECFLDDEPSYRDQD